MDLGDIMTRHVITMPRDYGIKQAIEIMANSSISSLVIIDKEGNLCGIMTERDLIRKVLAKNKLIGKCTLPDVMTYPVHTLGVDDDIESASKLMHDKRIKQIPIVKDGKVLGIVTQTDIVKEMGNIQRVNKSLILHQNVQSIVILLFFLFVVFWLVYMRIK